MNKTNGIFVVIIVVVMGGLGAYFGNRIGNEDVVADAVGREGQIIHQENPETKDAEDNSQGASTRDAESMQIVVDEGVVASSNGLYESYGIEKIARAENGKVVLFFHASWCPSCRSLNSDIEKNVQMIPAGITILKTDYDKETDLKKKYGVTVQHTLVQVDKDGNMIKKWSGGSELADLLAKVN